MQVNTKFGKVEISDRFYETAKFIAETVPPGFTESTDVIKYHTDDSLQVVTDISDNQFISFGISEDSNQEGTIAVVVIWLKSDTKACGFNFNKHIDFELVKKSLKNLIEVYNYPI